MALLPLLSLPPLLLLLLPCVLCAGQGLQPSSGVGAAASQQVQHGTAGAQSPCCRQVLGLSQLGNCHALCGRGLGGACDGLGVE